MVVLVHLFMLMWVFGGLMVRCWVPGGSLLGFRVPVVRSMVVGSGCGAGASVVWGRWRV